MSRQWVASWSMSAGIAGNDGGFGRIDGRDADVIFDGFDFLGDLIGRQADREHFAFGFGGLHEAAAIDHDANRLFERERAGDVSSGDFTGAMADDRGGLDSPGIPETRESDFDSEDGGLSVFGVLEFGAFFIGGERVDERPIGVAADEGVAFANCFGEGA